ncbi:MAG TPA: hypothetical protein VL135_14395 [Terracidiphilus sp.]|jgi:hypothetical protein|nr:hypothetical protein [Terracidiphilus sp.]
MTRSRLFQITGTCAVIATIAIAASNTPSRAKAESGDSRVQIGLNAAPVPLNMKGKNVALVGLGSYIVNVAGDCDGCHSAGPPTQFAPGGNPYFNQPEQVNPATYLGGGRDFGALIPGSAHIISRNLTPDASGLPIGGDSLEKFMTTIRTGVDPDHLHPPCTGAPDANCIPHPFDGDLLQIMPWPNLRHLSDNDLRAIYEYLSTIPCVQGNYPGEDPHRCG